MWSTRPELVHTKWSARPAVIVKTAATLVQVSVFNKIEYYQRYYTGMEM